jgi:manganese/zinc/iron transport system permease protein
MSLLADAQAPGLLEQWLPVVLLQDHTARTVLLGTSLLGVTAGIIGTFMLLRKRALVGDVVGHSALPGIALAFLLMQIIAPGSGKSLPALLVGAFAAGLAGAVSVLLIDRYSRVKSDAAMALVLSVFYGLGAALFTVVQRVPRGNAAGLQGYLNGKTASLVADDIWLFAAVAAVVLVVAILLHKEFTLLCFDDEYAAAEGWPVMLLDGLLIGLVVTVTVIGMQSVGLILVVATLIIPPAAARFWTDDIRWMTLGAGLIGGASAYAGTLLSSLFPRLAAGAVIVLCGTTLFAFSLACGRKRGVIPAWRRRRRTQRDVGRVDLLRAIFEFQEQTAPRQESLDPQELQQMSFTLSDLMPMRTWQPRMVDRLLHIARQDQLLEQSGQQWRLTSDGAAEAQRIVRNHRLWEMYLMQYADILPSHVDRDADLAEHVLDPAIIAELERRLKPAADMPPSSHDVGPGG